MLEPLKTLSQTETRAAAAGGEFVYSLNDANRSAIKLDVRYALRDVPERTRDFPLMTMLSQTVERPLNRIRFPADVLAKLVREIESVRAKLPAESPLLELADSALAHATGGIRTAGFRSAQTAGAMLPPAHETAAGTPSTFAPEPSAGAPAAAAAPAMPVVATAPAKPAASEKATKPATPAAAPKAVEAEAMDAPVTAGDMVRNLKQAAAQVEVTYVTTMELGDQALAGYLKYCLGMGEYAKIIEALLPRMTHSPRMWAWNLLTTAMRLAEHPDFRATADEFHHWLEAAHPETVRELTSPDDRRRFSIEKMAEIEAKELAGGD